jgi:hypothetical protein
LHRNNLRYAANFRADVGLSSFYDRPILNSPYRAPELHHPLDDNGQPLEGAPRPGRRPSRLIVSVPASRKKASTAQPSFELETYTYHALINEIRGYLDSWRGLRNPADWGVTGTTQRPMGDDQARRSHPPGSIASSALSRKTF